MIILANSFSVFDFCLINWIGGGGVIESKAPLQGLVWKSTKQSFWSHCCPLELSFAAADDLGLVGFLSITSSSEAEPESGDEYGAIAFLEDLEYLISELCHRQS